MSNLINKWNKTKHKHENKLKTDRGTMVKLFYYSFDHEIKLSKLAEYFKIGMKQRIVQTSDNMAIEKITYSIGTLARDIIEEYLNRDDIKELLEQIDKENK